MQNAPEEFKVAVAMNLDGVGALGAVAALKSVLNAVEPKPRRGNSVSLIATISGTLNIIITLINLELTLRNARGKMRLHFHDVEVELPLGLSEDEVREELAKVGDARLISLEIDATVETDAPTP